MPEVLLSMTAGDQVPATPLLDVVGRDGAEVPAQMLNDVPKLNTGVAFGLTVIVKETGVAHGAPVGVNV